MNCSTPSLRHIISRSSSVGGTSFSGGSGRFSGGGATSRESSLRRMFGLSPTAAAGEAGEGSTLRRLGRGRGIEKPPMAEPKVVVRDITGAGEYVLPEEEEEEEDEEEDEDDENDDEEVKEESNECSIE